MLGVLKHLTAILLIPNVSSASSSAVDTPLGRIVGIHDETESGSSYLKFSGIPYASAPVGPLRFLPPVPVKAWQGDLVADTDRGACPQVSIFPPLNVYSGHEDCLFLNVYTEGKGDSLRPVMIWIHGGAFIINRATEGGDLTRLVEQGVVSGNMGLKDQHLAIQWVHDNIANFGGDPDKITLFGQSAGGMSVHAQVLSPYNAGLLAGAISQSGTMLHKSLADKGPRKEKIAILAAETLNCSTTLDSALLECLQAVPVQELITKLINPFVEPTFQWYPVVDDYSSNPFLPNGDFNQIPFMSGTNRDEGALTYLSDLNKLKQGGPGALDGCELAGPARLSITHGSKHPQTFSPITVQDLEKVESIQNFYTGGGAQFFEAYAWPDKQVIIDMYTDSQFISPDQESLSLMSQWSAPVFNYRLTYKAKNHPILNIIGANQIDIGVFHGDDLLYFFNSPVNPLVNDDEKKLAKEMLTFWSNFAKSGSPGSHWKPFTTQHKNYMDLKPGLKQDMVADRMAEWKAVVWADRPSPLCS